MRISLLDAVAPPCAAQRTDDPGERGDCSRHIPAPPGRSEDGSAIRPGQFVMIRPGPGTDPLLGRPFALYDVVRDGRERHGVRCRLSGRRPGHGSAAVRRPGDASRSGDRSATASDHPPWAGRYSWPAGSARRRSWPWAVGGSAGSSYGRGPSGAEPHPARSRTSATPALRRADRRAGRRRGRLPRARASRSSWRPTTARRVTTASSPSCWHAGWSEASGPRRSSAAGRPLCSPP